MKLHLIQFTNEIECESILPIPTELILFWLWHFVFYQFIVSVCVCVCMYVHSRSPQNELWFTEFQQNIRLSQRGEMNNNKDSVEQLIFIVSVVSQMILLAIAVYMIGVCMRAFFSVCVCADAQL